MTDSAKSTVLYIVFGILLAFGINQGLAFALTTDTPIVAVESNSMAGTKPDSFAKGALLVLHGEDRYEVGDTIVYSVPGQSTPIVHRVVSINADGSYQTKGDANAAQLPFETRILQDQTHGKVVFIVPYLGYVKIFVTETVIPNIIVIVAAIAAIAAVSFVIDRRSKE